ncbi:MAG: PorP/SprF family type IX secretion system membrane protein [Chitinophagales bacterium]|nr:PorP/SprF family type IX secretion system membrane protein [Bacteroidota bacterium]MCB9043908.1 PorP/SprF family type IX secretion system membrane protein [Chitinophagales bacterium]
MRIEKILFVLMIIGTSLLQVSAQDLHYTQFYAAPLQYNPANTGNFNGSYRVGAILRSQWASVTVPYQTVSAYSDFALVQDEYANNWIGLGLHVSMDRAGDGILQTFNASGNVAFHKDLSAGIYISLGGSFGYTQKSIDFSKLRFNSQWNETYFDIELPSNESYDYETRGNLDVAAGVALTFELSEDLILNVGSALLHVNEPIESFYFTDNLHGNNRRNTRLVSYLNAEYHLNDYFYLQPGVFFGSERKARELMLGSNAVFVLQTGTAYQKGSQVWAGLWYRNKDAIAPVLGYAWGTTRALFSYDINISNLNIASNYRGGGELSIQHIGGFRQKEGRLHCPRF